MARLAKRIVGPIQLAAATATIYTVPAATRAVIRKISIHNPEGGSSRTYTLGIGADAAASRFRDAKTIAVGETVDIFGPITLEAAELLKGHASAATALVIVVDAELESA